MYFYLNSGINPSGGQGKGHRIHTEPGLVFVFARISYILLEILRYDGYTTKKNKMGKNMANSGIIVEKYKKGRTAGI